MNPTYATIYFAHPKCYRSFNLMFYNLGACIITSDSIKSAYNTVYNFAKNSEVILLGQCYDENPRLALTATNGIYGINVNLTDESGTIRIIADKDKGLLYNATSYIQLQSDYRFHTLGNKK